MKSFTDPIGLKEAAFIAEETAANFRWYVVRGEAPEHIRIGRTYIFSRKDMENWQKPHKQIGGNRRNMRKTLTAKGKTK